MEVLDEFYNLERNGDEQDFFITQKINLPRGRVVREDSLKSSPSHGFRKITRGRLAAEQSQNENGRDSQSPVPFKMRDSELSLHIGTISP